MVGPFFVIRSFVGQLSNPGNRVRRHLVSDTADGDLALSFSSDRGGCFGDPRNLRELSALGTDHLRALFDRYCVGVHGKLFPC